MLWIVNILVSLLMAWFSTPGFQQTAQLIYKAEQLLPYERVQSFTSALDSLKPAPPSLGVPLLRARAQAYLQINSFDAAIDDITAAIQQVETPHALAALITLRGQAILYLYEWDNVLAEYNAAIRIAPDYPDVYFYRAVLYYSALNDRVPREDALADFETYLRLAPQGELAPQAEQYADLIRIELDTLNAP